MQRNLLKLARPLLALALMVAPCGAASAQDIVRLRVEVHTDNDDRDPEEDVTFNVNSPRGQLFGSHLSEGERWNDWSVTPISINLPAPVKLQDLRAATLHVHKTFARSNGLGWAYKIGRVVATADNGQDFVLRSQCTGRVFSGSRRGESGPADHNFPLAD